MPRRIAHQTLDSGKERLKWTEELHHLFEKVVNQLGGAERATPKGILKAMGIPELTIYHVKSHLQKYRISKFIPESTNRGKFERRNISEILPNFSTTSGVQLNEALQMQSEVEKRLSDQLEVQRSLKLKIEAQGRFLEKITEDLKNRVSISTPGKGSSPIPLPSLCEVVFNSNYAMDLESDTETYKSEVRSKEFQASKRNRTENEVSLPRYIIASLDSESFNHNVFLSEFHIRHSMKPTFHGVSQPANCL